MTVEYQGEIVIAPRVLEVITGIAAAKVDGVHSLQYKRVADSWSKTSLNKGIYLETDEEGRVTADIYVYLEYGVNVPAVSMDLPCPAYGILFRDCGKYRLCIHE